MECELTWFYHHQFRWLFIILWMDLQYCTKRRKRVIFTESWEQANNYQLDWKFRMFQKKCG